MPSRTYRIHGTGPALRWDEDGVGGTCEWSTPASLLRITTYGPEPASIGAALFFAGLNRWRYAGRRRMAGDVIDCFDTPRGPAIVLHTQKEAPLDDREEHPGITLDLLPEPWVQTTEPWETPFRGYVLRWVTP